jgi:uncharacterized protein
MMASRQREYWRRVAILTAGWGLIAVGLVGLFVPVLQGILMIAAGLLLLAREYHWARKALARLRRRFPNVLKRKRAGMRRTDSTGRRV